MENKKRCAIYTRKSVEEGLEQEFNTLDAQRAAAENYIASQIHKGWVCLPKRYDDGGFSGGTVERPALQELLRDAEAGEIDIIVVYKIDRLSRSLLDFAELSKKFDLLNISFVSVTQEINTSSSSGRMMLNILMTFAQYEREIISERIRDKMSASRKKGMWVGGTVPYGFYVKDKKLLIDVQQAEVVRFIFRRYCEVQSVKQVAHELVSAGHKTKQGKDWPLNYIYRMLNNHTYVGEVNYKGEICKGEHRSIVDRDTWNRVQEVLESNSNEDNPKGRIETIAPLKGILQCGHCKCNMGPTYGEKKRRRYPYYLCTKDSKRSISICPVKRVSASEIENQVIKQLAKILSTPTFLNGISSKVGLPGFQLSEIFSRFNEVWPEFQAGEQYRLCQLLIPKVFLYDNRIELFVQVSGVRSLIEELGNVHVDTENQEEIKIVIPIAFHLKGGRKVLVNVSETNQSKQEELTDKTVVASIARAHRWQKMIDSGEFSSSAELAKAIGVSPSYVTRLIRLNYLSPKIVTALMTGTAPSGLSLTKLVEPFPDLWSEQYKLFGFAD